MSCGARGRLLDSQFLLINQCSFLEGVRLSIEGMPEYRRYLEESGFHEHTFISRFEKTRNCKSGLTCDGREVEEHVYKEFEEELSEHLTLFIQWLRRNNGD